MDREGDCTGGTAGLRIGKGMSQFLIGTYDLLEKGIKSLDNGEMISEEEVYKDLDKI